MSADPFIHGERELVASLGLSQKAVRAVRAEDLDRTVDWETIGGEVRYSDVGRSKLLGVLKISSEAAAPAAPEDPAPAAAARAPGALEDLVCVKCYKPNRRMLEARTVGGDVVLVRVKDNVNLLPGMTMPCRFEAGRIWTLARRLPRHRGKW